MRKFGRRNFLVKEGVIMATVIVPRVIVPIVIVARRMRSGDRPPDGLAGGVVGVLPTTPQAKS